MPQSTKTLTSSWLTALFGMLCVAAVMWCIRKSTIVSDIGVDGMQFNAELNLFQRLHLLWLLLLLIPGGYIGASGLRASVLCGACAYGFGSALGWSLAERSAVLADPILRPAFWRMLGQSFCFGVILGVVLVVLGQLCRRAVLRTRRQR
jgi:ABC-type Fe3+ transport system permease subunit